MRRSRAVPIATLSALALAVGACGDDEETAYCVDENDVVVENDNCDDEYDRGVHTGFFWLFYSGNRFKTTPTRGQRLPTDGAQRIAANDRAALQSKGGFGSRARSSGVGRSVSSGG